MKNKLLFFLTILFVSSKLAAENFSIEAKNIYRKDFKYLTKNNKSEALILFKRFGITLIPIVDKNLYIIIQSTIF